MVLWQVPWGFVCFSLNTQIIIGDTGFGTGCIISLFSPKVNRVFGSFIPWVKELMHFGQVCRGSLVLSEESGYWPLVLQL